MSTNLFKKAIIFTDIHFGLKSNSISHNNDCGDFVDWIIAEGKAQGCDTCIFMGDWHHTRASINIQTLNHSLRSLEKLADSFSQFFHIIGNHDMYHKDKRDVHSMEFSRHIKGMTVVNDILQDGDCTFVPWLVQDDYKKIKKNKTKYMFGHFELPHFFMNAMVQMPDHGQIKREDFTEQEHVFSGHFHKRQSHNNITYIGNAFPHNYADVWDNDRGATVLEWGEEPTFKAWPMAPKFIRLDLSALLESPDKYLQPKTYARVTLDIDISYEEANYIKEQFMDQYNMRELSLISGAQDEHTIDYDANDVVFESVDQIVLSQLGAIESIQYDPNILMSIYNNL